MALMGYIRTVKSLQLKSKVYNLVLLFLNFTLLTKIFIKVFEIYCYSNLDKFSTNLLAILQKSRVHFSSLFSKNIDFDLTYVSHLPVNDTKSIQLLDIYSRILSNYNIYFSSFYGKDSIINEPILKKVPELRHNRNHYCFLTSTATALNAKVVIDVGTASGSSMTAFLLAPSVKFVHSFDINPLEGNKEWVSKESFHHITNYLAQRKDNWVQYVSDLTLKSNFTTHASIFEQADIILVDIDHSGKSEQILLSYFESTVKKDCLIIWDDIRVSTMQQFWDKMTHPKLDVGSIGHGSGTGISLISRQNYE
jgi:predicted O-methyltransferase YrrM